MAVLSTCLVLSLVIVAGQSSSENETCVDDISMLTRGGRQLVKLVATKRSQDRHPGHPAILSSADVKHLKRPERWHGVNYGNRFVPEDWIKYPYDFFQSITDKGGPRSALWDLFPGKASRDLMLTWLSQTIQESHFQQMQSMGVEVMRLPVGYWNFVTYENDEGPAVPADFEHFKERLKNLHRIATPEDYKPYFDKIFTFASKYGVKVLLDLHGVPGSQNGEIHSGACMRDSGGQNVDFFQMEGNTENREMALKAIRAMAKYSKDKDALWGIQVINEPHLHNDQEHQFLKSFFKDSCKAIREEGIPMDKPCVVFTWTFDMSKWIDWSNLIIFPPEIYGRVIFDTHLYHFEGSGEHWTLEDAKSSYNSDLDLMRRFFLDAGIELIVGEYTLAGNSFSGEEQKAFAQWLVNEFDFSAMGSFFSTFDCQYDSWSLVKTNAAVTWHEVWRPDRDDCIPYNHVQLRNSEQGYLSAQEDGAVKLAPLGRFWETWQTCYKKTSANLPGAVQMSFRSIAHGNFLSVSDTQKVSLAPGKPSRR